MSRVYIKNLPMKVTEEDIREHFRSAGTITDVELVRRKDGSFKRIAFVGFYDKTYAEIKKKFDGSIIKTSKISIYEALSHSDAIATRRKRNAPTDKKDDRKNSKTGAQEIVNKIYEEGGEELAKYLQMGRQKAWQNELLADGPDMKSGADQSSAAAK